jgi:hypothetical protein
LVIGVRTIEGMPLEERERGRKSPATTDPGSVPPGPVWMQRRRGGGRDQSLYSYLNLPGVGTG